MAVIVKKVINNFWRNGNSLRLLSVKLEQTTVMEIMININIRKQVSLLFLKNKNKFSVHKKKKFTSMPYWYLIIKNRKKRSVEINFA